MSLASTTYCPIACQSPVFGHRQIRQYNYACNYFFSTHALDSCQVIFLFDGLWLVSVFSLFTAPLSNPDFIQKFSSRSFLLATSCAHSLNRLGERVYREADVLRSLQVRGPVHRIPLGPRASDVDHLSIPRSTRMEESTR